MKNIYLSKLNKWPYGNSITCYVATSSEPIDILPRQQTPLPCRCIPALSLSSLFLYSSPPLFSLLRLLLLLYNKHSSFIFTLYSQLKTRKTPTPRSNTRGVGLHSWVRAGDLHHLCKDIAKATFSLMFSKHRSLDVRQLGKQVCWGLPLQSLIN